MTVAPPRVCGLGTAVPAHVVSQRDARALAGEVFGRHRPDVDRFLGVFDRSGVRERRFVVPPEWFEQPHSFAERNDRYVVEALRLSVAAARAALDDAGLRPDDLDALHFVSSTGIATPSLDARLVQALGCPPTTRRDATFGHGCAGGVGGLARAAAQASARPGSHVMLVATELCSLTFRLDDFSTTNLVATSLFADGAAAVVVSTGGSGPVVVADSCTLWPDTVDVMGFHFSEHGMQVLLDRGVPHIVRRHLADSVDEVCRRAEIDVRDVDLFLLHPGGAKVLAAYTEALPATREQLGWSHGVLADHGNMSAPTALFVLRRALDQAPPAADAVALMSAMGPGFAAEHVLLRW